MSRFSSILVANRGEIALRVIRTARAMGYRTLAVYSEADAGAPHVRAADDAACIGPAPATQSYLSIEAILKAAKELGAEAIHPGYGFLSESAEFARACDDAGLVFIGPPAEAIALMGNKAEAKRRMLAAGVPCVPGYEGEDQSEAALLAAAEKIGAPLMVKAAAGGGGRGMRLVEDLKTLPKALSAAASEAENAFGSGELILEKAILRPRHVEVQVFADDHGTTVHMGERDCSVQRRHQKVVEEAPCPVMTPKLRADMGAAAVEAACAIGYRGAGTVEFLLGDDGQFYFLEMNTRLQVEHPVTELVTGLDLVELQLRVAEGRPLGLTQDDIRLNGHAIEVRLYAEDPAKNFLPRTGHIRLWEPAHSDGLRFDMGVETGQEISPFYDPMIGKMIAWGPDREAARRQLVGGLKDSLLIGLTTNQRFLIDVLEDTAFVDGQATTAFIDEQFPKARRAAPEATLQDAACAAALLYRLERDTHHAASLGVPAELLNWASGGPMPTRFVMGAGDTRFDVTVTPDKDGLLRIEAGETRHMIEVLTLTDTRCTVRLDGKSRSMGYIWQDGGAITLSRDGRVHDFQNQIALAASAEDAAGSGIIAAPMPGLVLEVSVAVGAKVAKGDVLAVIEAMKMQHEIRADMDGVVAAVDAAQGLQVTAGDRLLQIDGDG
ncbi:acetyl/propionyl/methylcrotonyl-CoA carboxylase subunit alpha [Aestuariivita boseongensis]|uniref:acetyl/propionyl/methylcrotonyl-CoA carboxylase subunit alpha n=1 Tax=Aestuariivita boseongensis TaxID=1470562 RepID=UPI000682E182|nr:biotin carboxylase N-terminal domain-containing protein [Aestuariivita boseongensis]